jgi:hypothetical protein
MLCLPTLLLALFTLLCTLALAGDGINDADFPNNIITRDVCIIGGGSGGTYPAIRLQQMGKSVVVVEKKAVLGGHTNTYIDPVTGAPVDYGVAVWEDIPVVQNYFAYLGVALTTVDTNAPSPFVTDFADFASSTIIPSSALPQGNPAAAFAMYLAQLAKYPYLDDGFDLPSPIPDDLLLPFGDFIKKYQLDGIAYIAFQYAQGTGNMLAQLTLYILKLINTEVVGGILNHFLTTAQHDNHELYDKALAELGSDALLNSTVIRIDRSEDDYVRAVVSTPSGQKLIKAKKLLIAIPPKLHNLGFLDLDGDERHLFGQFNNSYYWTSIVRNSGVPDNTSLENLAPTALEGIPAMPGIYAILASGVPGLHQVYYGSSYPIPTHKVKSEILSTIASLVKAAGFPPAPGPAVFAAFSDHSPFELTVSTDAIKGGFYQQVNALQGKHQTWWTGAAWQTEDSSLIWNFTEYNILPQLVK